MSCLILSVALEVVEAVWIYDILCSTADGEDQGTQHQVVHAVCGPQKGL